MGSFKLSLPTDIPWRRICVSDDMMDPLSCDDERPPRWHSSLAAFRYDPPEEYQPYASEVISYIKVIATITPFQQVEPSVLLDIQIDLQEYALPSYLSMFAESLTQTHPCYGAMLQVTVAPTAQDREKFGVERYPYFIDCEPKKRELYEIVSDTNEVLSGSSSSLAVGKSATSALNQESLNVDLGGSFAGSASVSMAGVGISGSAAGDDRQQVGTVHRTSAESANVRQAELATERRELYSHTTQLAQMYNLLQAFHVGTNRTAFLFEPRPHIRQTEATFIDEPRAMEGMQEVFLVVVRPKEMTDFCVGALLETLHLVSTPADAAVDPTPTQTKEDVWQIRWSIDAGIGEETQHQTVTREADYPEDPGWEITGFALKKVLQQKAWWPVISPEKEWFEGGKTSKTLKAVGELAQWVVEDSEGIEKENARSWWDVTVSLRRVESVPDPEPIEYFRQLFLSARELCCCPPQRAVIQGWITRVVDVGRYRWRRYAGAASPQRFIESRRMAAVMRKEMVRSLASPWRYKRGEVQYTDSDAFYTHLGGLLKATGFKERLSRSLSDVRELDDAQRGSLYRSLGHVTVGDILTRDSASLARVLGLSLAEVAQTKRRLVRELGRGGGRPPA